MREENYDVFFKGIEDGDIAVIDIEGEDETIECGVLAVFSAPPFGYEYLALVEISEMDNEDDDDEGYIIFMRYIEYEDGSFTLEGLDDAELDFVTEAFYEFANSEEE